jgi:hypothetical protein
MIHLAGGWGWRRVYRKNNTTIGCALGAWRLTLGAARLAHIRIILKWSSAPFAHFLTPDPLAKYFKGLRINAYANGSGLKGLKPC